MDHPAGVPSGTVTFLFTDIEGSSPRWERDPSAMMSALRRHNEVVSKVVGDFGGHIFKATGDGFNCAFATPLAACDAAIHSQLALCREPWPFEDGLPVRMGLHTGTAEFFDNDYFGPTLNRLSRIMGAAHGGQILVSSVTAALLADHGAEFRSLGTITLAGMIRPEEVHQVCHPQLRADFPPLRIGAKSKTTAHNLLPDERPFIGREKEVSELKEAVLSRQRRLITISGIGGMGKTRLSREVARQVVGAFPDGVWFVECEALAGADELLAATCATLGVPAQEDAEHALIEHLGDKRLLLVFDCFEHLASEGDVLAKLLRHAPDLQCLVSSRVLLGNSFEYDFPLGPMQAKVGMEGVALFQDAATHVQGGFKPGKTTQRLIAQLVSDLEGVPLAIVLAAGRMRHLSLKELQEQVRSRRLEVLQRSGGKNDRHANLIRVIEGSFALISPEDQTLLARLSVFEGGFYLEDALEVMGAAPDEPVAPRLALAGSPGLVLEGIARLRDHSLLAASVIDDRMRYRALDTIREYLARVISEEDAAEWRMRHARYFAKRARHIKSLFDAGSWQAASSQLWRDAGNFRAAVRTAITIRDYELTQQFARCLARAYLEAGASSDFLVLAEAAQDSASRTGDLHHIAELYGLRGAHARRCSRREEAEQFWLERLRVCRQIGDAEGEADTLTDLTDTWSTERLVPLTTLLKDLEAVEPKLDRVCARATVNVVQAQLLLKSGQPAAALQLARRAESLVQEVERDNHLIYIWRNLAEILLLSGDHKGSIRYASRMLKESVEANYVHAAGVSLFKLADAFTELGLHEEAARAIAASLAIPRSAAPLIRKEARARASKLRPQISAALGTVTATDKAANWLDIAAPFLAS